MSTQLKTGEVVLEPAAQEFADATAKPPFLYELGPDDGREVLEGVQRAPIDKPDVDDPGRHGPRRPDRRRVRPDRAARGQHRPRCR